jgi:hypothetical protein
MIQKLKDLVLSSKSLRRIMSGIGQRALPLVFLLVAVSLLSVFIPVGDTLWSKVLGIRGTIKIATSTPTPEEAGEGCSLGFWKQDQHFSYWPSPYDPYMKFEYAFGEFEDIPDDLTLLDALQLGGGGPKALMRQATAALLNAQHPDINFRFTTAEVIAMFQTAYLSGEFEPTKDKFEVENETGCPLKKATPTETPLVSDTPTEVPTETNTPIVSDTPTEIPSVTPSPTITDTPEPKVCTYTMGYWKNHPEAWPVDELTIGGETYSKAEAIEILEAPPKGDASYILAHQLIAAKLNILNGADEGAVADVISEADSWFEANPIGSDPKGEAREEGIALAETLDDYNNGEIGPGHCKEEIGVTDLELLDALPIESTETPTPKSTPTNTVMPSEPPTQTPTSTPEPI